MKAGKRILSVILCCSLIFALAACGSSSSGSSNTESNSKESGVESTSTENQTEKDYSEKMTISLASIQIADGKDYTSGDDFTKYWTDKFNVEFEITSLTWENWAERLRVWINSDDMPDWIVWNYLHGEAVNYSQQGLGAPL